MSAKSAFGNWNVSRKSLDVASPTQLIKSYYTWRNWTKKQGNPPGSRSKDLGSNSKLPIDFSLSKYHGRGETVHIRQQWRNGTSEEASLKTFWQTNSCREDSKWNLEKSHKISNMVAHTIEIQQPSKSFVQDDRRRNKSSLWKAVLFYIQIHAFPSQTKNVIECAERPAQTRPSSVIHGK